MVLDGRGRQRLMLYIWLLVIKNLQVLGDEMQTSNLWPITGAAIYCCLFYSISCCKSCERFLCKELHICFVELIDLAFWEIYCTFTTHKVGLLIQTNIGLALVNLNQVFKKVITFGNQINSYCMILSPNTSWSILITDIRWVCSSTQCKLFLFFWGNVTSFADVPCSNKLSILNTFIASL